MSEIFGYSGQDGRDWFNSVVYDEAIIESIKDPEGGAQVQLPTAIPSPFARLDLVRIAFEHINRTATLKMTEIGGEVIAGAEDERLVSYTLDLLELFFNYTAFSSHIKIIRWSVRSELTTLMGKEETRYFGDALKLFIEQDERAYNFDLATDLYVIKYDYTVIGTTSPVSLFCPSGGDLSALDIKIPGGTLFREPRPLYVRPEKFQKFIYYYFKKYTVLTERMPFMTAYIRKSKTVLELPGTQGGKALSTIINRIQEEPSSVELNYSTIGSMLIFNGSSVRLPLMMINPDIERRNAEHAQRTETDTIRDLARASGFRIQSTKYKGEDQPLALRNNLEDSIVYLDQNWNNDQVVPNVYQLAVTDRPLPGTQVNYPHLVVSDFLEPVIMRMVYPVSKRFFDGNYNPEAGQTAKGYLLPLKLKFFEYFSVEELRSGREGSPSIEMEQTVSAVTVTLKIPVADKKYITFERMYYELELPPSNAKLEAENKGLVKEHQVGLTLFPFVKTKLPELGAFYRVQLVDRDRETDLAATDYQLEFYKDGPSNYEVVRNRVKIRSDKRIHMVGTKYYVLSEEFDLIIMRSGVASAVIIPAWEPFHQGNTAYDFALDFGTTNTHIEYRTSQNRVPRPFDISSNEIQIATLFDPELTSEDFAGSGAIAIRESINEEFVPFKIGKPDSEYSFPHRTVLATTPHLASNETATLADYNIPFIYEKNIFSFNSDFETDLKWSKYNTENFNKIRAYFEELIFLIRNKVLINKGRLGLTKLIWFYPTSMQPSRVSNLKQLWEQTVRTYMPDSVEVFSMPESLAPFFYYKFSQIIPAGNFTPAVSVDIGGGTSDVVVFKNNEPLYLTSFKFAANTLFGDAFSSLRKEDSGMLGKHLPHFKRELGAQSKYRRLNSALDQVSARGKSADINAFLFSLENNQHIEDAHLFSYDLLLNNDEDLKIVFLYFYSAIIYHVSTWMKTCGVEMPNHLFLSGTGSKMLNIISYNLSDIETLSARILEKVYGRTLTMPLKIITDLTIPKEATCKGGILSIGQIPEFDLQKAKKVLNFDSNGPTTKKLRYDQLDADVKAAVIQEVKAFNNLFLQLNDDSFLFDHFSVSSRSFNYFKDHVGDYLDDYLADGIKFNMSLDIDEDRDKVLEESLFFLPLTGVIYQMINVLAEL